MEKTNMSLPLRDLLFMREPTHFSENDIKHFTEVKTPMSRLLGMGVLQGKKFTAAFQSH